MKQRFSSLDVKVIAHELSHTLVSLRLANIYDLSSKILLFKFAKPDEKRQLVIDSGFRCHLTEFVRTTAAAPSPFVARLRKFLKSRRLTAVAQIGTDRIIEFRFSDGMYRLYLEFFASGNVILTDSDLKILTLMRNVPEGEGQEPQRVGLTYTLENRQNFGGVPLLTKERLREALQTTVDKKAVAQADSKKAKSKAGDELRKGLATTITEFPPVLVEHALATTSFDSRNKPAEILENEAMLDSLFQSLEKARNIVEEVTRSPTCKGYIFVASGSKATGQDSKQSDQPPGDQSKEKSLYEDFHPFLPHKYEQNPAYSVLSFDGYNKTVDEFFSSMEGRKLASRVEEREAAAKRKLEAARQDQDKRVAGLQEAQALNERKAAAIEANVERVWEAIDAVNGLVDQGMDWVDIGKLIERERKRGNPVAEMIRLPLKLAENTITVLVGEEEFDDDGEDMAYETDSEGSEVATVTDKLEPADKRLEVDINLGLSPWANAREYHDQKRSAAVKAQKTVQQSAVALKNAEQKIAEDLRKGLKQEKAVLQPIRRQMWFEKFMWFLSSDGYLVLGGRDAQQNEMLYKRHLRRGDVYVHAELHGAASVIIKNNPRTPDAPIPPSTLSQAGNLSVCSSSAWDSKAAMAAWWVAADQVSKSAPTGEFLPSGSFMVRGKKNFLPPAQLLLGFGLMFKISPESKARHLKHRLTDLSDADVPVAEMAKEKDALFESPQQQDVPDANGPGEVEYDSGGDVAEEDDSRANPLQQASAGGEPSLMEEEDEEEDENEDEGRMTEDMADLQLSYAPAVGGGVLLEPRPREMEDGEEGGEAGEGADSPGNEASTATTFTAAENKAVPPAANKAKSQPPKRGHRGKAKKAAARYKDQDDEDRALRDALVGATVARQRAEAEATAKREREAEAAATLERRKKLAARREKETAEHEEARRAMMDEGIEAPAEEEDSGEPLDALVGTPLPGDEILEVVPVCAPWMAMARVKYRAKMQPGAQKKGKAVKEIVEKWRADASRKNTVDETARDVEKMWPREVELIKALRAEEMLNCVPVGKVKVMMAGGGDKGGGSSKSGGGGKGKDGKDRKKGAK